jgi:phage N-6-adenine-methyltransferase
MKERPMTVHSNMYDDPKEKESPWRQAALYSSKHQAWRTPSWLIRFLNEVYDFDLDAAASSDNALCERYLTEADDSLSVEEWPGDRIWLNPPYGRDVGKFVAKASEQARVYGKTVVVVLVFARTDTAWWHDYAMRADDIYFIRGRLKFTKGDEKPGAAPAPSALLVFRGKSLGSALPRMHALNQPRDKNEPS